MPRTRSFCSLLFSSVLLVASAPANAGGIEYPDTKRVDHVDVHHAVEVAEPTRFRYLRLRNGKRSFPEAVTIQAGDEQDQLESLFERHFRYQGHDTDEENLVTALAHHGMALDEAIQRTIPAA